MEEKTYLPEAGGFFMKKTYFIIDFDSTLIQKEGLDELAGVVLKDNPKREEILLKIQEITDAGMEGKIAFDESLNKRLQLLSITSSSIEETRNLLKKQITPSFLKNKSFFSKFKDSIYIVSGGFREFIIPVAKELGIKESHILANTFVLDKKGNVVGVDIKNPLSQKGGKARAVESLKLEGEIFVIGDGYTDYEIKETLNEKGSKEIKFIAFTENKYRESVVTKADYSVPNFDEFLYVYGFPPSTSYPKHRLSVLLLENIHQKAIIAFEKEGYAVEYFEKSISQEVLKEKIPHVSLLGIRSKTQVTKDILHEGKRLLGIGAFCIGTDQIDLLESKKRGVAVFNAPYSNTRSVVELAVGEIIMLSRGVFEKSNKLHQGIWDKSATGSMETRGKTLGIVGYGNIGSQLSVLAENLGMKVVFFDTDEKLALGNARKCESLKELFKVSDVISLHIDGSEKNRNLIDKKSFAQMKQGVIFLNLSRGIVVSIPDLTEALKSGKVRAAALDVFPEEPEGKGDKFVSSLQLFPQVILTPHVAGSTLEAQEEIGEFVAKRLIEYLNTGSTMLSVSLPQINPPKMEKTHRLLHIHTNTPGVLAKLNHVLVAHKRNILGQYLKTDEQIGYVVTDINKKYDETLLSELKQIDGTIKTRILY